MSHMFKLIKVYIFIKVPSEPQHSHLCQVTEVVEHLAHVQTELTVDEKSDKIFAASVTQ